MYNADNQDDIFFARIEVNIRQHAKHQRMTLCDLAAAIDMTEAGFYKMLSTDSMKVKTLKKIAEVLNLPVNIFFEEFVPPPNSKGFVWRPEVYTTEAEGLYITEREGLKRQIELLESQIADKNKIIELLSKK
ncbi:helix-turn-helix domain-containing protein [Mucilaginibacter agri]|uniref:Helix-turn-helix domain-containing protein n=1 Tax=Mucilaginibacter agri TaxID=2695265 RepID=A0A966DU69_9SPHI|nr:helix-turn-helix domain-containing protein [Mucilaginibacter agri]NCD70072.1 helix-turn-helix domain-containing protein [Mucilaginibacter agri]